LFTSLATNAEAHRLLAGKIFDSPEVVRVYTGSYWNGALINSDFKRMFEKDEKLLVRELIDLPRCAAERKVNQMVNRIRLVKVHVCLLGALSKMTPRLFGKKKSRDKILNDIGVIMDNVRVEFDLSKGDMPDPKEFAQCLKNFSDFSAFPPTDRALIKRLDSLIANDIPSIVRDADDIRFGRKSAVEEPKFDESLDPPIIVQSHPCAEGKSEVCLHFFCCHHYILSMILNTVLDLFVRTLAVFEVC
jgi:hypothetical protein